MQQQLPLTHYTQPHPVTAPHISYAQFAVWFKQYVRSTYKTQAAAATALGVYRGSVNNWCLAVRTPPSQKQLRKLGNWVVGKHGGVWYCAAA